ncbi:hypothetical protein [Nostoc sp. NMS4]|uniref:hypothetical protein n=1 Tax=Nostoc sp. NMS4 TaxID=2815390 RepID=UPI0025CFB1B7|nr:hypothetical protein [Nostoc sp. NMS4]MBN3924613.1 hypothetical protein [Nostoc sp. NMS4]
MESKTFSIRLYNPEIDLLQAFQESDESLNQTIARLVRDAIGAKPVNKPVHNANIKELITEKIDQAVSARTIDRELIRDEIDNRTAYLATAMNEVKSQLENEIEFLKTRVKFLEQNQGERLESPPVIGEMTNQDAISPMLQDKEDAIAPELTEENVISPQAGKQLSKDELRTEANTIYTRLKRKGLKISATIIKEKILEMYPNSDDWISDDARKDVIKVLEKEHQGGTIQQDWKSKTATFLDGISEQWEK